MRVQEAMTTAPLAIDEEASLEAALRMMNEHSIRHLPVVAQGKLRGIISNRDLLERTGWRAVGPRAGAGASPRCVRDVMNREAVTVSPEDDVVAAAEEMIGHSIGCLPVTEDGRLVGMLSPMDLFDLVSASGGFRLALGAPIGSLLKAPAVTVASWSTLHQVDNIMHTGGGNHVPVMDGDQLVGIISDHDMRRAAGEGIDGDTAVLTLMTEPVATVDEQGSIKEAAAAVSYTHLTLPTTPYV